MKAPHSAVQVNLEHSSGKPSLQKNRPQRKLPGGAPPVVTYSRLKDEDLAAFDDGRAEPRFDDDPVAEWDAVEVPPVAPPLHARRRARPLVEEVQAPLDETDFEGLADEKARPKRSTSMRLIAVVAGAAILVGIAVLVFAFGNSTSVTVSAPALNEGGTPAPGTVPADDVANVTPGVREIPLNGEASPSDAGGTAAPAPVSTAPVEPPAPRARPEPPASAATAAAPDFDQAAPLAPAEAPLAPKTASAPADSGADDAFIANIERTLAQSRGASAPALSPASEPIQLAPQVEPGIPVPPENIPMTNDQGQPLTLPKDFLIDTE